MPVEERFEAPGPGMWNLDRSHFPGGTTPMSTWLMEGCANGMRTAFSEIGMRVRARSPFPVTLFCGYTNGYRSYLPTASEIPRGGYEVDFSLFGPGGAERLEEGLIIACDRDSESLELAHKATADVPMLDLSRQYAGIRTEILAAVTRACDSQRYILGEDLLLADRR